MLFERFTAEGLAHYSYVIGNADAGRIAVIDPGRDVDRYLDWAERHSVDIGYVLETHIHADFASGARELAERTGAELWESGYDEGEAFEVAFPHRDVHDGDALELGPLWIQALHTPGHTPEHLSYLVYDVRRSRDVPLLMFSGDFLLVGSLGRPDLLGEAEKERLAGEMHESVTRRIAHLPGSLEVYPAHGAGSLCGAGLGRRAYTTLGYERATNPYLRDELPRDAFIERLLSSLPPYPAYYRRMKRINADGPTLLGELPGLEAIPASRFRDLVEGEHTVVDLRDQLCFGGGHIPSALGIGAGPNVSVWASYVVPYDRPVLLVAPDTAAVEAAVRHLIRVGLDRIVGYLDGGIEAWRKAAFPLEMLPQIPPAALQERREAGTPLTVLDVRSDAEWDEGHIEGAVHVPGRELPDRLDEVPDTDAPLAVICGSGYRSTVASSVLQREGFATVHNVPGGMTAWERAGLPTTRSPARGSRNGAEDTKGAGG